MFCTNCGKKNSDDSKFCEYCGEKFTSLKGNKQNIPIQNNKDIEKTSNAFQYKKFIPKIVIGVAVVLIIYIIFAEKPFSLFIKERSINQELIAVSVVNIVCESQISDELSGGSGTIISPDGLIITNAHIIPQDEEKLLTPEEGCLVVLPDQYSGQPKEIYWAQPIVYPILSDKYDLAYLQIHDVFIDENNEVYGTYPKEFRTIFSEPDEYDKICVSSSIIKLGDSIKIYGYPLTSGGLHLTITEGIISSLPEYGLILTSAKIDEGNSGGLAVDKKGCMVGIPSAISEGKYQNLGVIISTDLILDFFDEVYKLKKQF
jgi:serine protease Do